MCANLDPKAISQVEGAPNAEVFAVPSGRYPTITAMMDKEPGNNPDFRIGIKHLQRRDRVLKVIPEGRRLDRQRPTRRTCLRGWLVQGGQ